jgi:hypothetical protein
MKNFNQRIKSFLWRIIQPYAFIILILVLTLVCIFLSTKVFKDIPFIIDDYKSLAILLLSILMLLSIFVTFSNFVEKIPANLEPDIRDAITDLRVKYRVLLTIITMSTFILSFLGINFLTNLSNKAIPDRVTKLTNERLDDNDYTNNIASIIVKKEEYLIALIKQSLNNKEYQKRINDHMDNYIEREIKKSIENFVVEYIEQELSKDINKYELVEINNKLVSITNRFDSIYQEEVLKDVVVKLILEKLKDDANFRAIFPETTRDKIVPYYNENYK